MTVSPAQRRVYRHAWRALVTSALAAVTDPDRDALKALQAAAHGWRNWVLPTDDADTHVFAAIGPMAVAFSRAATVAARAELAPGLRSWCERAAKALNALDPPSAPLRPRADIDG